MRDDIEGKRVFIYARVSTTKQAANDISVPDQVAQAERWIAERGAILVKTFIEPGASATKDSRRVFQQMISEATSDARSVDIILVHSLSRLFRNALHYMQYRAQLRPHRVSFVSITQEFGDDPASELALSMVALFDEYHSAENAKHVRRTMIANAKAGNWNGQTPPIGFRTVAVPQPRGKDRKRLEIDPATVHVPRFIFDTYVNGTAEGEIGITRLAQLLNERGERLCGKPFHTSSVHAILTNTAYIGVAMFNKRDSRTRKVRPEDEWIPIPVPPIIPEELFFRAQALKASRDPKMGEAAQKTNTNLLTGHVICGAGDDGCGGGMTTETSKSGQYRYYSCHKRTKAGPSICKGRRVPMEALDKTVIDAVKNHVLRPDRLESLLRIWLDRSSEAQAARQKELKQLRTRLTLLDGESANVIKLVRLGVRSAEDRQIAAELSQIDAQKKAILADIDMVERQLSDASRQITPEAVTRFGTLIDSKLNGEDDNLRRAYVRLLIDRVEVGDREIRITGSKAVLAQAASGIPPHMVPKAERKWCARQDSNLRPQA